MAGDDLHFRTDPIRTHLAPEARSPLNLRQECHGAKPGLLLVAVGEQEDFHSFFAPQQPGAAFGNLTVSLSKKGHLLGHSPQPGGLFWRAAEADGLRAVFLLLACCYQEAPRITGTNS